MKRVMGHKRYILILICLALPLLARAQVAPLHHQVRLGWGDMMFETIIPRSVKLSEAPSYGEPISTYHPDSKGAKAYAALAEEVIDRG